VDFYITQFRQSIPLSGNPAIRQSGNPAIRQSGNPAIIPYIPTCLCQLSKSEESHTISFSLFGTKIGFLTGFLKPFSFENGSKYTLLPK